MVIKLNVRSSKDQQMQQYGEIESDLKDEINFIDDLSEHKQQNY